MAEDDWWSLLRGLLAEHDDDIAGERLAVLDFHMIHTRHLEGEP
jgi:hypothetical protein